MFEGFKFAQLKYSKHFPRMLRNLCRDWGVLWLLLSINWIHIPCIIVEIFAFSPITNCSCKWTFHAEGVSWRGEKKKKKIWLAVTVCPFPAFLAYFLLPFPLWWQIDTFVNDRTRLSKPYCFDSFLKCPGLQSTRIPKRLLSTWGAHWPRGVWLTASVLYFVFLG